ncbi:MAG: dethiobiotin synthase [Magnetococcales bacterium]|nr:dethiobiotin synthase [Magnetococcales bacterium]
MTGEPRGLFITGTGTGVGKSVAAAWLVRSLKGIYWKPVQSGLEGETDSQMVRRLAGLEASACCPSTHVFKKPRSPHEAAAAEGVTIALDDFHCPAGAGVLVVEGAGGVLVPLNDRDCMVDLMVRLALPVVLVAGTALGTINHTLLSLEALRARRLRVAGVILNGSADLANREAIRHHGRVGVLAEIPPIDPLTGAALDREVRVHPDWKKRLEETG